MPLFETSTSRRWKLGLAGFGLFVLGTAAGGVVGHHLHPPVAMAPLHPVAIRDLASSQGIVAIRGRVAESFGTRLVIDDGTGRTLVDAGPHVDNQALAPLGAAVTVQGRFDRDAFHPDYLVDASGTVTPLGPPPGPRHGRHPHPGPGGDSGPDVGPNAPPPGPPAAG